MAKLFVPLIKRSVSTKFQAVFGKFEFLTENQQPWTLQKWWKFCTISKCAKKIFFGKILCSTHSKKCFYNILGSFWKIKFLTENRLPRTLQKWWKFYTISKCAKKLILTENRQPRTLQKWWKFCTISKCAKKIFFGKILCTTHPKKCFYKILGSFWKIEFMTKIDSRRPYKNGGNFVLSQNVLRKYFLAKLFVPLIKRSVSTKFKAVLGKLNFPLTQRSVSINFQIVFLKLNF